MELPEDVLNEILDKLELNDFIQFIQVNKHLDKEQYWKNYYHRFNMDLKSVFPNLFYKELVQIITKVNNIFKQVKNNDVYLDLKESIMDPRTLIIDSHLIPSRYGYIDAPMVAIELKKIRYPISDITLYTEQDDFIYTGSLENLAIFLSYLIYLGRI